MSNSRLNYKKVSDAYNVLTAVGAVDTAIEVNRIILNYIKVFPGCNNTELELYVANKRNIIQSQISLYLKELAKYEYIIIKKNGKENNIFIGPMYYELIKILDKHMKFINYNIKTYSNVE